jgi:competence protein ComEC
MPENFPKSQTADFAPYPMLWLACCFAFGILAAKLLDFGWQISLLFCLIFASLTVVFIRRKIAVILLSVGFLLIGALFFQIENQTVSPNRLKRLYDENQIKSGDPIEIEGTLTGAIEVAAGGFFLELKSEKAIYKNEEKNVSGNIRLFASVQNEESAARYEQLNLQNGSRVRVACNLKRENKYLNPGVILQKEILDQMRIDATGAIKSPFLIEKLGQSDTFSPFSWIYSARQFLIDEFRKKFDVSTTGVLNASLLGDKYFLDKQTAEIFREGGTFHVLVISGLHITFIGGLMLLFVRLFTRNRFWQFLIATTFLWAYSLAVGADVPVIRAAIMFTILLFSQVIYRRGTLLNALGSCVLILLVWRPGDLFSASFQLTIVSVAAIVVMAFPLIEKLRSIGSWSPTTTTPFPPNVPMWLKRFCETLYWRKVVWERDSARQIWTAKLFKAPYFSCLESRNLQNPLRYIFEAITVSLIVQAWLLPFLIIYFHRISIFAVFLNIWVGIIIALESFAALFAVFLAQISDWLAFPFVRMTEFFNLLLISVPNLLTENYWASVRLPNYSGSLKLIYFLYFLPILFFTLVLYKWKPFELKQKLKNLQARVFFRLSAAAFLILLGLIIFHPFSAAAPDGKLHIDFLDVGQGDSALIAFPDGETLLIDGGGKMNFGKIYVKNEFENEPELFEPDAQNIGESVVSAFLWYKGLDKIDYILATHADADHIQGLSDVAKNFKVKAAFFGRTPPKNENYAELQTILQKRGIETIKVSRGDVLTFGDTKIEVLFPFQDESNDAVSDNNHSIVLRITFGEKRFLLTGDIEKDAEKQLLQSPEFLQADVVKVAHHGSKTSSTQEFIGATRAQIAIIPVGNDSPFGHPHKEVLERWRNSGAKIFRTGERGTISISTNGQDLQIETFDP